MYINNQTLQYPFSENEIRSLYPTTSFTFPFNAPEEFSWVFPTPQPNYDAVIRTVRQIAPIKNGDNWFQQWEVVPRFVEYTKEDGTVVTVAEQETAAIAADLQQKAVAIQNSIVKQTQNRLDDFARTRNYDSILSACTYATSGVPKFQAEGQYCVDARDNTWATLYSVLAEVQAGTRPMPSGYADVEPLLPALVWPN